MAYYDGAAADMTALRTALIGVCTDNGWSWNAGTNVLSKGALHLLLTNDALNLSLTGRTSASAGDMPGVVQLGRLFARAGYPTLDVTYPAAWEAFVFTEPDEVWFFVRYDVDRYQWCSFGGSNVAGLAGSGMWVAAIRGSVPVNHDVSTVVAPFSIGPARGGNVRSSVGGLTSGAWGWNSVVRDFAALRDIFVHSNLDGHGWYLSENSDVAALVGVRGFAELVASQPSAWNSEAALLPMRAYKNRPSNKLSLVVDLVNSRHVRIDNYAPGQVIELGSERWKVFPWHRRDVTVRDGTGTGGGHANIDHTGTFGVAIRYDGP